MSERAKIVLGTRGSELARAQTTLVENALSAANPGIDVVVKTIRTLGDEGTRVSAPDYGAGRKGLFTGEIERALRERLIDVAVHSAKDLPSDHVADLQVCATLSRAAIEDVLILKQAENLTTLPLRATIATGSVRRRYQVHRVRADLNVIELRGNVPTRLRKLMTHPWEGILLARAGLDRLGHDCSGDEITFEGQLLRLTRLPVDDFVPAGGQGIVALQSRTDDLPTRKLLDSINHPETLECLRVEREFLRLLQGDCGTPVGVVATREGTLMTMRAQVFSESHPGPRIARLQKDGPIVPEMMAAELLELING